MDPMYHEIVNHMQNTNLVHLNQEFNNSFNNNMIDPIYLHHYDHNTHLQHLYLNR
jgi:hypothetical protein